MIIVLTILVYFLFLLFFSRFSSKKSTNENFYRGNRNSLWYLVAFGMIGASISGVTFVSVPGMVQKNDMTYLQMCLGFVPGYFAVAFLLLPIYYRLNLTTIYSYLKTRLGARSYKTGASFFLLSKLVGAIVRFYIVCFVLQKFVLDGVGVPFFVTVVGMVGLIWLYTYRGGIQTLVWTDSFQTVCMFTALLLIIWHAMDALGMNLVQTAKAVSDSAYSRIFVFDDWHSRQYFWKQFLSGMFVVVVMTGLDQDMMQKNLTCKTLKDAQKDMCTYGFGFIPANFLFLVLGVLLVLLAQKQGIPLPDKGDALLPMFAASGRLGYPVVILFTIGVVAASFSSADSALTALTTSYCVDLKERPYDEGLRKKVHLMMSGLFVVGIFSFHVVGSTSVIDAIYILCGYTYGPLLGLFAFGLLTHRSVYDKIVPYIATLSPICCFMMEWVADKVFDYRFGYELLMFNGLLTFLGLLLFSRKKSEV